MVNFIVNLTMILWAVSLFWLARERGFYYERYTNAVFSKVVAV